MALICDSSVASNYTSPSQRARVISECWFQSYSYCLACDADSLIRSAPNTIATDFKCPACGHSYELKTFRKRPSKSLIDGAYSSLISRINAGLPPTLCLLERNEAWEINSLTAIHSSLLTPWAVQPRPPLKATAKRAGWVGCNIRLDRIPPDGEIAIIADGIEESRRETRRRFQRFLPLSNISAEQRGWTGLTLTVIRQLQKTNFSLKDLLYERKGVHRRLSRQSACAGKDQTAIADSSQSRHSGVQRQWKIFVNRLKISIQVFASSPPLHQHLLCN